MPALLRLSHITRYIDPDSGAHTGTLPPIDRQKKASHNGPTFFAKEVLTMRPTKVPARAITRMRPTRGGGRDEVHDQ